MKNYFIYENNQQVGPFTFEDLKARNINSQTPIWTEGMPQWSTASQIDELKKLINISIPPPFTSGSNTTFSNGEQSHFASASEKTGFRIGKFLGWKGLLLLVVVFFSVLLYWNSRSSEAEYSSSVPNLELPKTPEQLRAELLLTEQQNPGEYIKGSFRNWKNFIGERVIEIDFVNKATLANFKDIEILITFLTATQTEIGTKRYNIYKYLPAGGSIKHKLRVYGPEGTSNADVLVSSATPY